MSTPDSWCAALAKWIASRTSMRLLPNRVLKRVAGTIQPSSREAAACYSPARKCRVRVEPSRVRLSGRHSGCRPESRVRRPAAAIPFILTTASDRGRLYDSYQRKASVIFHHLRFSSARFSKLGCFVVAAALSVAPLAAQKSVFVSFDAPGAARGTLPLSINLSGDSAGEFIDVNGGVHSFVRRADGDLTEFDAPTCLFTLAIAINGSGQIAGQCAAKIQGVRGFVRQPNGRFVHFDVPGSVSTLPSAINDGGEVAGVYYNLTGPSHGFLRDAGGNFSTFDPPNAGTGPGQGTTVRAVNANGEIVGYYLDTNSVYHGFIRDESGNVTSFDAPGAGIQPNRGTFASSLNSMGAVTGWFADDNLVIHGFVRDVAGNVTPFDMSGTTVTEANYINDSGVIVGWWQAGQKEEGFLRTAGGFFVFFGAGSEDLYVSEWCQ